MSTGPEDPSPHRRDRREQDIVAALRRIIRAVDLHSRRLVEEHGLTAPQLATLSAIAAAAPVSPAEIADRVHLSRPTVTGILERLRKRGLVDRTPSTVDRRRVSISLTELGRSVLSRAPSLLQERFRHALAGIEDWEQLSILATLERIASMMDATGLDASPHLVTRPEEFDGSGPPAETDAPTRAPTRAPSHATPRPRSAPDRP